MCLAHTTTPSTFSCGFQAAASWGGQHQPQLTDEAEGTEDTYSRSPGVRTRVGLTPDPGFHRGTLFGPQPLRQDGIYVFSKLKTLLPFSAPVKPWFRSKEPPVDDVIFKSSFQLNCVHSGGARGTCQAPGKELAPGGNPRPGA